MPVIKLDALERFQQTVNEGLLNTSPGNPIRDALDQWGAIYRGWAKDRFATFAKGGGDWAPLAPSTIAGRRRGKAGKRARALGAKARRLDVKVTAAHKAYKRAKATGKGVAAKRLQLAQFRAGIAHRAHTKAEAAFAASVSILWDTGTLIAGLNPTLDTSKGGMQQGIKNGVRVGYGGPAGHPSGKATIADIASFHQSGGPHLHQRIVIAKPPDSGDPMARMAEVMEAAMNKVWKQSKAG